MARPLNTTDPMSLLRFYFLVLLSITLQTSSVCLADFNNIAPPTLRKLLQKCIEALTGWAPTSLPLVNGTALKDPQFEEVTKIWASLEDFWQAEFKRMNQPFRRAKLVIFSDYIISPCGELRFETLGLCYCTQNNSAYLSFKLLDLIKSRHASVDPSFRAFALAHEYAHHVQKLLTADIDRLISVQTFTAENNRLSVATELNADALAGYWLKHAHSVSLNISDDELENIFKSIAQMGDDSHSVSQFLALTVEDYRHGTSQQRAHWTQRGFATSKFEDISTIETILEFLRQN